MEKTMDRRQRRTREAIFRALAALLSEKDFGRITVGEIIERADVGRATFYAHFETKDDVLKQLCDDLFCHIADAMNEATPHHRHLFTCEAPDSVFLHLFHHIQHNDQHLSGLLSGRNAEWFLCYFKTNLQQLILSQLTLFADRKSPRLPDDFWVDHITCAFVDTLRWWMAGGMKESPETITEYFLCAV